MSNKKVDEALLAAVGEVSDELAYELRNILGDRDECYAERAQLRTTLSALRSEHRDAMSALATIAQVNMYNDDEVFPRILEPKSAFAPTIHQVIILRNRMLGATSRQSSRATTGGEFPVRCQYSGNPCGTDAWTVGQSCPCPPCQLYVMHREALEAVEAERDAAAKRLTEVEEKWSAQVRAHAETARERMHLEDEFLDAKAKLVVTAVERDEWADAIRTVAPGYISTAQAAKHAIVEMKAGWDETRAKLKRRPVTRMSPETAPQCAYLTDGSKIHIRRGADGAAWLERVPQALLETCDDDEERDAQPEKTK